MNYEWLPVIELLVFAFVVDPNRAPVAKAGGDQLVVLPSPLVIINGSASSDDKGIVSHLWTRDKSSPAAGVCVCYHSSTSVCVSPLQGNLCFSRCTVFVCSAVLEQHANDVCFFMSALVYDHVMFGVSDSYLVSKPMVYGLLLWLMFPVLRLCCTLLNFVIQNFSCIVLSVSVFVFGICG